MATHNKTQHMIDTTTIRAGRLATILLTGEHKMNKGGRIGVPARLSSSFVILADGRAEIPLNPLYGRVTRDHRITVTVAGPETYANVLPERTGEAPAGKAPWFTWVKDGLVMHKESGALYLAAVPTSAKRVTRYLVDGREATEKELEIIRDYTPDKGEPQFLCFALENVANLAD